MNGNERMDRRARSIAWGALLILIGSLSLVPGDQTSLAVLGSGAILLGLNVWRSLSGIAMNGFSIAIGAAAFLTGAVALIDLGLGLHFEIELFPILLIAVGIYFLWPSRRNDGSLRS